MLKIWSEYKYLILGIVLLIYSAGLWHVSSEYTSSGFKDERISMLNEQLRIQNENATLNAEISRTLQEGLDSSSKQIQGAVTAAVNEIRNDPRYRDCRITDGVRKSYSDAIKAQ